MGAGWIRSPSRFSFDVVIDQKWPSTVSPPCIKVVVIPRGFAPCELKDFVRL